MRLMLYEAAQGVAASLLQVLASVDALRDYRLALERPERDRRQGMPGSTTTRVMARAAPQARLAADSCQRVAVVGIARQRLGMQHELAAGARALVVTIEALTPNS